MKNLIYKAKKNIDNFLKIFLIINVCLMGLLIIFPIKIETSNTNNTSKNIFPAEKMLNNNTYSQVFISSVNYLNTIGIRFSTYSIENTSGSIYIQLLNDKNDIIHKDTIPLEKIKDNEIYYFRFPEIENSKNKKFTIAFNYKEYNKENSLTYWYFNKDTQNNLKVNEKSINQEIELFLKGKTNDYFAVWYPLTISVILYAYLILIKGEQYDR